MSKSLSYTYDEIKHETDKAWLLEMGDSESWFPKSQCRIDKDEKKIIMPAWLAISKGLG